MTELIKLIVICHLSLQNCLLDAYTDVFRAGKPRPYRFNY